VVPRPVRGGPFSPVDCGAPHEDALNSPTGNTKGVRFCEPFDLLPVEWVECQLVEIRGRGGECIIFKESLATRGKIWAGFLIMESS
jgi:hypothetical protein